MDTLSLIAVLLTVAAGITTFLLAAMSLLLRRSHREAVAGSLEVAFVPKVLRDPRSCLQAALEVFDGALSTSVPEADIETRRRALQLTRLLQSSPSMVFSEVIDDRALLDIEQSTSANVVWIVSTDESIEFEYPSTAVAFSGTVFDNLRREISYRYFVMDTVVTRERSQKLIELIRGKGFDDHLQIRFLPDRYWEKLRLSTDELIMFDSAKTTEMYYRFPDSSVGEARRWIKAPDEDSKARLSDLRATWETAQSSDSQRI